MVRTTEVIQLRTTRTISTESTWSKKMLNKSEAVTAHHTILPRIREAMQQETIYHLGDRRRRKKLKKSRASLWRPTSSPTTTEQLQMVDLATVPVVEAELDPSPRRTMNSWPSLEWTAATKP
jgi:hypothetical protein